MASKDNKGNEYHNLRQHIAAKPRGLRAIKLRAAGNTWKEVGRIMGGFSAARAQALAKAHSK